MRYIVEIKPEYEDSFKGVMILGAKDSNLFVDTLAVENLEELNSDYINEHFSELQDTAYQRGLEDGKAQSERGCKECSFEGTEIYLRPCSACCNAYPNQWTAKDDKIEVGDVVTIKQSDKHAFVVTKVSDEHVWGVDANGSWNWWAINDVTKTDKHYDIDKILEELVAQ